MYKKRQKIYKDLQLQSNNENSFSSDEEGGGESDGSVNNSIADGGSIVNDGSIANDDNIANDNPDVKDKSIANDTSLIGEQTTSSSKEKDSGYKPLSLQSRMKDNRPIEIGYRSTIISSHKQDDRIKRAKYNPGKYSL